jgi:hypothetical protein
MQASYDSASLTSKEIALPAPNQIARTPRRTSSPPLTRNLIAAHRQRSRGQAWENLAWALVGLSSLTVLLLSLF